MKLLPLLFLALSVISCASQDTKKITYHLSSQDAFALESLSGYSSSRINDKKNTITRANKNIFSLKNLERNSNNFLYWNALGNFHLVRGNFAQALYNYKLAKGLVSNNLEKSMLLNNQALLAYHLGKRSDALSLFKESVVLNRQALTPKFNLASIFLELKFYNKSRKILSKLHKENPKDLAIIRLYGVNLYHLEHYRLAADILAKYPKNLTIKHEVESTLQEVHNKIAPTKKSPNVVLNTKRQQ